MKNSGYCLSLICLFISLCIYGCKDNAEESITEIFEIATEDLIQNFSKDAANVSISITTNLNVDNWEAKVTDKWLRATQFKNSLKISVDANIGSNRRTANVKVSSATKHYTITVTQYSASDIVIEEDIQVKPYAGKASEEETDPDRSIEHSFDDKFIADGGDLTTVNGDNRPISRLSWNTISRVIRILIISSITLIQETAHSGNLTYIRRRKKTRNTCIREAMTSICATLPPLPHSKLR